MADNFKIGASVALDGEKEFKQAVTGINKEMTVLGSEMKKVTAQFADNSTSMEALKSKQDVLSRTTDEHKTKVELLKNALESAKKEFGESSDKAQDWQIKLNNAEAALAKTESQLKQTTDDIDKFGKEANKSGDQVDKAGKQAKQSGDDAKQGGDGWNKMGDGLKTAGKMAGIAAIAVAVAVGALVKSSLDGYAEYEQLTGGVETLFKDSGDIVLNYANNAYKTAGLSANEYMSTVTSFSASLLSSLGGDTAKAATAADVAITDMADNANKMGTSMEVVQATYQSLAKQNYAMLDNLKLGYGGTKGEMERLLADAEKLTGVKYDITNLNDVYSAIHAVQTELGITGTTAKEASTTIEGSVAATKSAWGNLVTGIADDNADFDGLIKNFVDSVAIAGNNIIPRVEQILVGIGEMITQLAPIISEKIPEIITKILPSLLQAGAGIITSLIQGILTSLPTLVPAVMDIILELTTTLIQMLPQIIEVGLQVIISLALGIADALPELIPTIVDAVITIVETLIDNIDLLVDAAIAIITALAEGLIAALPKLIEKAPELIVKFVSAIIENAPKILSAAVEIIGMLISGLVSGFGQILGMVGGWVNSSIIQPIKDKLAEITSVGTNLVKGLWKGISDSAAWLLNKVKEWCGSILNGIKAFFGIHSPSTVMEEVGLNLGKGEAIGIEKSTKFVLQAAKNVGSLLLQEETRLQKELADMELAAIAEREAESEKKYKDALESKYAELAKANKSGKQKVLDEIAQLQADREKELNESSEKALKESLNNQLMVVQNFQKEYEKAIAEVQKSQDRMSEKLLAFGELFKKTKDAFGGESFDLINLQPQIDAINNYGKALEDLKARGVSSTLLEEIKGMSIEDATAYTSKLLTMTDTDYAKYMALWEEKQAAAKAVATKFYKDEMDALKAEFADKIPKELSGIKDQMKTLGIDAGKALANSISAGFASAFIGVAASINGQISAKAPQNTTASMVAKIGAGVVNGVAGLMGGNTGGTYVLQTILDGKVIAQSVFDPLKDIATQRGV